MSKILLAAGIGEIGVADSKGMIYDGRDGLNPVKAELATVTNGSGFAGAPEAALRGADVFIGLSGAPCPRRPSTGWRRARSRSCSPTPSRRSTRTSPAGTRPWSPPGAATSPTRSTTRWPSPASSAPPWTSARPTITENMKLAAADAIAALVGDDAAPDYVIPSQFDERVAPAVAAAVAAQARADGVARR